VRGGIAVVAALVLLGGCTSASRGASTSPEGGGASPSQQAPTPTPTPPQISVLPAEGATDVVPTTVVHASAASGIIDSVTVKDDKGATLAGTLAANGWSSTARLRPAATYTVSVTARGSDDTPTTTTSTFSTIKPKTIATYGIVYNGMTVGIGMPVSIQFDSAVTKPEYRAQVEKLVSVTTVPQTEGAWGWLDNRQLMWRPKNYWAPGTKVTVKAPLTGVQTGDDKWVANDVSGGFTIGNAAVSTVDIARHVMTVTMNGQVVKTIPVSTGRPGPKTETRSGVKVIIGKERKITMDSETIGIKKGEPGYYKIDTDYNLRVTWTGEFLHSAPWSVSAQGNTNVSHGCVNMSPANAQWMYDNSKVGDIVKFTGSSREFLPDEGIGVWQYSWDGWLKQSAL
jgi:lipoprotein-anchoring transpeptidase ErfK/SrfK